MFLFSLRCRRLASLHVLKAHELTNNVKEEVLALFEKNMKDLCVEDKHMQTW